MNLLKSDAILQGGAASAVLQPHWWYTPLLSGVFALIGVLIAQGIVLYLAHRNDRRRSEPELLKHCAEFSATCGRLKRELSLIAPADRDLSSIAQLETSYDALLIIGTPEIQNAAERFIGILQVVLLSEGSDGKADHDNALSELFKAHLQFIDAVRKHFNRPRKIYKALPMIEVPNK